MKQAKKFIIPTIILAVLGLVAYMVFTKKTKYQKDMTSWMNWITAQREKGEASESSDWVRNLEASAESKGLTWEQMLIITWKYMYPSWLSYSG